MKFWDFSKNNYTGERVLRIDGVIAAESWHENDVTPKMFLKELHSDRGDILVWINSPGGDCIAASQIHAMLLDYPGKVTVKIDGAAYSAASVIAMAGSPILMAPSALMMIHNPWTVAVGDAREMLKACLPCLTK